MTMRAEIVTYDVYRSEEQKDSIENVETLGLQ